MIVLGLHVVLGVVLDLHLIWKSLVQCSAVQCSAVQRSAVHCSAVPAGGPPAFNIDDELVAWDDPASAV